MSPTDTARRTAISSTHCWACIDGYHPTQSTCRECGAPPWTQTRGPNGVYIVRATEAGMFKIGISKCVPMRVANFGKRVELVTVLWGANRHVESWLHDMFADGRVPAHTEWFWATHGPRGIGSYDREFIRDGCLWEDPT